MSAMKLFPWPQSRTNANRPNVTKWERATSVAAGTALAWLGYQRGTKGILPLVTGGMLIHRGVTGHCALYEKLGVNAAHGNPLAYEEGVKVTAMNIINCPRNEVYAYWRDLQNLPKFMWHIHSVDVLDREQSHWTLKAPLGRRFQWDAEIINDIPDELIAWKSLPGADIDNAGSVTFKDASYDRGTEVRLSMHYSAPGGNIGTAIARLLGHDPTDAAQSDLERLKKILEADGEVIQESRYQGRSSKLTAV